MTLPINVPRRVLVLMFFGFLVRLVWAWLPEKYLFYLVSDDAYYYFTIARNFASRGIFSADGITLTNGFHPLWLFLITPIFILFKTHHWLCIHLALSLSALFDTAAAILLYKTLEKLGKASVGFWAAVFYLFNPYGVWNTMNGLETALNNFFLAALIYLSVSIQREYLGKGWLQYGIFCGLALLSRTDNIFTVGVFLLYLLWRHKSFFAIVKTAGVASFLVVPWLAYNYAAFGSLVQTSGTAYPFLNHDQYLVEYHSFFSKALIPYLARLSFYEFALNAFHYGMWPLTTLIGLLLMLRLKSWPKESRLILWTLIAAFVFAGFHLFVRWSVRPWYAQTVFVLTLPAVAVMLEKTNRLLLSFGVAVVLFLSGWRVRAEPFQLAERSRVILDVVNNQVPPGERAGVFNSGFVQYFTDRKVINLDGLVNNEILIYYRRKAGKEYLRKVGLDWVVDHGFYITKTFGPYWGRGAQESFVLTDIISDIGFRGNSIIVLHFIGNSPRPSYGRWVQIDTVPAPKTWARIPFYPKF